MMQFKGFKPEAAKRIAVKLGYGGDMSGFNTYLKSNPDKMQQMKGYSQKAIQMVQGGYVKGYSHGGFAGYTSWRQGEKSKGNDGSQQQYNQAKQAYDNTQHATTTTNNTGTTETTVSPKQKKYKKYSLDAMKMMTGKIPVNLEYDYNGDGKVDMADASSLLRIGAGMMGDEEFEIANPAKYAMDI